jgi:hypothetical protein
MRRILCLACLATFGLSAQAQEPQVRRIQEQFAAARPSEKSLAFYTLDWAMSLADAKERARKEDRPILLVLNTNITAGTNFFSGHT